MPYKSRSEAAGAYPNTVPDASNPDFAVRVQCPSPGGTAAHIATIRRTALFNVDGEMTDGIGVDLDDDGVEQLIVALRRAQRSKGDDA